jgi:anti-anti-sigma factor
MSQPGGGGSLEREDFGHVTVLRVKEPMLYGDAATEALFQKGYAVVEEDGRANLVLDLSEVVFLSSSALGGLVTLRRKAQRAGGRLVLCKVSHTLQDLLRLTHLADILLVYADEREAAASFTPRAS